MDPDSALAMCRAASLQLRTLLDMPEPPAQAVMQAAAALVEAGAALDQWMTRGGFLPVHWQAHR